MIFPRKTKLPSIWNDTKSCWVWLLHYTCWKMHQNASGQRLHHLQAAVVPFRKEPSTEGIQNNQGNWVRGIVCLHLCYMKKLKLLSSSQFICLKNKLLTSCSHTNVMKNKILSKDVATYEWGTAFWARAFVLIASTKGKNFLYTLFLPAPSCKFDPSSVMHMKDF